MKITDFVKPSGIFLKAIEVKNSKNPKFVITTEATMIDNTFKGKVTPRLHMEGEMESKPYIFDLSKTNARIIAKALGEDTKTWIGHVLTLETYRTKTSDGTLTDAINVTEVK